MARSRQQKLSVFLLKEGVDRDSVVRVSREIRAYQVRSSTRATSLFVATTAPHRPGWQSYLDPHVDGDLVGLLAASCGAVLLVEASEQLFAVTFGQGRHLLRPDSFEPDFGLRVVLNTVAPDQLKSVDTKTVEEKTVHTRRDISRDSSLSAFGLDVSRDLVRSVTGTPRDSTLGSRLTGSDALAVHTRLGVPELPDLMARLHRAYEATEYREHFDFIDHLRLEKRRDRIDALNDLLVGALTTRQIDDVHLAAPETLDWQDVDGFRFSTQRRDTPLCHDPRISMYLDSRGARLLTLDALKRDRMTALRASNGEAQASWAIYRCVVYQTDFEGDMYVLSAGDWFRVNLAFKDVVYADVQRIPVLDGLPDADPDTDEAAYNIKAAAALGGLCLDRQFVYDGGPDKMEICDILLPNRTLVHVKPRGSSSTLSHLFTQGLNSAERLVQDPMFREGARIRLEEVDSELVDLIPLDRPEPTDYTVAFAVISRSNRDTPLTLPFFSLVSLRAAAKRLDALGFTTKAARVFEPAT